MSVLVYKKWLQPLHVFSTEEQLAEAARKYSNSYKDSQMQFVKLVKHIVRGDWTIFVHGDSAEMQVDLCDVRCSRKDLPGVCARTFS